MFLCLGRVIPEFKEIKTADLGSPKIEATLTVDQTLLLLLTVSWKLQSQRLEVSHVPHSLSHSTPQHHPEVTLLLWAQLLTDAVGRRFGQDTGGMAYLGLQMKKLKS